MPQDHDVIAQISADKSVLGADHLAERARASWREVLPIHPAAELFPLMDADELATLAADIQRNGLITSIALWQADKSAPTQLLDGRNRLDALELVLGRPLRVASYTKRERTIWSLEVEEDGESTPVTDLIGDEGFPLDTLVESIFVLLPPDTDPYAYVTTANLHRRHLTAEQKRELIAKLIALAPEKSDRQFGKELGVDHKTIARARAEGEDVGKVPHVEKRTDSKGRHQPARRPKASAKPKPATAFDALGWWGQASPQTRAHFIDSVGRAPLCTAIPAKWDFENRILRAASTEKLLAELERRLPADVWNEHRTAVEAFARVLAGPTLDLTAPISEMETKH
jgi:hypothetical protein